MEQKINIDVPQFMSGTSYDSENEFIIYTGSTPMLFVVEDEEPQSELYRYIQHDNGDSNYAVFVKCMDNKCWATETEKVGFVEKLGGIFDQLEEWYKEEIADLDNYEE